MTESSDKKKSETSFLLGGSSFLLVLALVVGGAWSASPPPSAGKKGQALQDEPKCSAETAYAKECAAKHGVIINVSPSQTINAPASQKPDQHDKESPTEWWLVIPTWVLAISTFLVFFYTFRLANATHKLVEGAKDTAEKDLRAYLGIFGGGMAPHRHDLDSRVVYVEVRNAGKTPAHDAEGFFGTGMCEKSAADDFQFTGEVKRENKWVMTSGSLMTISQKIKVVSDDYAAIKSGEKIVFVWGKYSWRDEFGSSYDATFRYRVRENIAQPDVWGLAQEPDGNKTEERKTPQDKQGT